MGEHHSPIERTGDRCPACGEAAVFEGLRREAHGGEVFIDGCGACKVLWERETRAIATAEPCSNCAWLAGSPEIEDGRIYGIISATIDGDGIFYCHRRVPFTVEDGGTTRFRHEFDHALKRCTNATVCAGWIKAKLREKHWVTGKPPAEALDLDLSEELA